MRFSQPCKFCPRLGHLLLKDFQVDYPASVRNQLAAAGEWVMLGVVEASVPLCGWVQLYTMFCIPKDVLLALEETGIAVDPVTSEKNDAEQVAQ